MKVDQLDQILKKHQEELKVNCLYHELCEQMEKLAIVILKNFLFFQFKQIFILSNFLFFQKLVEQILERI